MIITDRHLSAATHHSPSFAAVLRSSSRLAPHSSFPMVSALAIAVPRRRYATETSNHGGNGGNFPPPGFNVNEAKKAPTEQGKAASNTKGASQASKESHGNTKSEVNALDQAKDVKDSTSPEKAGAEASKAAKPDDVTAVKKEGDEDKKLTLGQKIKKEVQHYWDGTKLLATEVKISSKLALKMAAGYELSRRENRQVKLFSQLMRSKN